FADERTLMRETCGMEGNVLTPRDNILGVIFPSRYRKYYSDWHTGFVSVLEHRPHKMISEYVAMRIEADLKGIATPASLVGRYAYELNLDSFGFVQAALTEFTLSYKNE